MLIKVRPDLYINTSHILSIHFREDKAQIKMLGLETVVIPATVARGLLEFDGANDSLNLDETPPEPRTLKSQLAVILRNTWKGASLGQLDAVFPDAGADAISSALTDLQLENVAIIINGLWYHASSSEAQAWFANTTIMPNPDPLSASEALPDASDQVAADSAPTIVPKNES